MYFVMCKCDDVIAVGCAESIPWDREGRGWPQRMFREFAVRLRCGVCSTVCITDTTAHLQVAFWHYTTSTAVITLFQWLF